MKIKKHHIYLADLYPRFCSEPGKRRPVVVIQTDLLNDAHPSTVVCPITSKVIKKAAVLRVNLSEHETGLKKESDIMVDQIRSIDNRRFIKELGKINPEHQEQLLQNLKIILLE